MWVVRKGATPAFSRQKGFVGGSMGDCSVILEGVDSKEGEQALYSTVHGAGRVLSRTRARYSILRAYGLITSVRSTTNSVSVPTRGAASRNRFSLTCSPRP